VTNQTMIDQMTALPNLTAQQALAIKELQNRNDDLAASANTLGKTFTDIGANAFAKFFDNVGSGTKTVKQAFFDLVNSIEGSIMQLISKDLANQLMQSLFGANGGGASGGAVSGGGWIGALASLFGASGAGAGAASAGVEVGGAMDLSMPIVTALASGGPTSAGGMYEVSENAPELLTVAHRTYLMMGDRTGKVSPMTSTGIGGASGGATHNWNMNIAVPPATSRATVDQQAQSIMSAAQRAMARNG
jgi:hypothetical protein